jgi:tight adherence protein B
MEGIAIFWAFAGSWLIPTLVGVSTAGISFYLLHSFDAGADTQTDAYSELTARQLEDVFLFIPSHRLEQIRWACAGVVFALIFALSGDLSSMKGFAIGFILATISGACALNIPTLMVRILRKRRLDKFNSQLVDTLVGISNSLKAGFSIMQAIESVVKDGEPPISQEFDMFLQQTRVGVNFSDALANMEQRVGSQDFSIVVSAVETARKTGGNLTEILEAIAKTIRERMRIEGRIRTLTAQGRLQGIIVGSMPLLIILVMLILDPETMKPFLYSMEGLVTLAVTAALVACGALMIRKIINIDI